MIVYTPYYDNAMLGGNEPSGPAPLVNEDAGTPFAVTSSRSQTSWKLIGRNSL